MNYISYYQSPFGKIILASDGKYLIGLWFDGQKYSKDTVKEPYEVIEIDVLIKTREWLDIYFSNKVPNFLSPLKLSDSPFRKRVQEIMLEIAYGQTMTYGEIAKIIAKEREIKRMSAQAVGGAIAHNSISIIIPCHRVIASNGSLTGYSGGIDKKTKLLEIEKQNRNI